MKRLPLLAAWPAVLFPGAVSAAELEGGRLSVAWGLPFVGVLLSIALMPLLMPRIWHLHQGKVAMAWALAFLLPFGATQGWATAGSHLAHAAVAEYLPFIVLLTALFTVAGGIHIRGNLRGTPALNTAMLAMGAVMASFMGTTGASMLLIRPLIRANAHRNHQVHTIVFFIFIVSNAGGALTPLGDPPLFLGFLKGVDFFWTVRHIFSETLFLVASLLVIHHLIDRHHHRTERTLPGLTSSGQGPIDFDGAWNFVLLAAIAGLVLMSGVWTSPVAIHVLGTDISLPSLVRDVGLLLVTALSLWITPARIHHENQFSWAPMAEVAKLFAGIFVTIVPVIAMLKAGAQGPFGPVVAAVTGPDGQPDPAMYFWATGLLSSFLDNAPTYLVFFNTAGGDPQVLMGANAATLAAISAGAVFMGANTYIGNAPNLMVKAIAEDRGVRMPSFFGYMLWSIGILLPLFVAMTFIWFR